MLYSVDSMKYVDYVPHLEEYRTWVRRLSADEYQAIVTRLEEMIEGDEIHTSSWMPGNDWMGTVFFPIYEKSCLFDIEASGKCFGLILWKILMDHDEVWGFSRYEKDGIPIEGMTYFRIHNPPERSR